MSAMFTVLVPICAVDAVEHSSPCMSATVWDPPEAMAETGPIPSGVVRCPNSLDPQATTAPLGLSATVCDQPAAMAVTTPSPGGVKHCPDELSPQATTPPPASSATVWK